MSGSVLRIDHVLYGAQDLDAAAARFSERLGLASYAGGRHTGRGTGNMIVPLGHDYVELLGVVDAAEAARAPTSRWLQEQVASGDRLVAWCVSTDDLDAVVARLDLTPTDWSRTLPDGTTLRWRLAGREMAAANPALPFFIDWQIPEEQHPSRVRVPHQAEPDGIAWIEVQGRQFELRDWLGTAELPVRVTDGPPAVLGVGIRTADGEIVIR